MLFRSHEAYHVHSSGNCGADQGYRFSADEGLRGADFASWLVWPNVVFEYYPGGKLTLFHNKPVGPERTQQVIEWYLPEDAPNATEQEVIDFVDVVREEDIPIVESVQRGLQSLGYDQSRYVADDSDAWYSESGLHRFHRQVLDALA